MLIFLFQMRCSSLAAALQIQWWVELCPDSAVLYGDFFWRSGLLEYWILLYGLCFALAVLPGLGLIWTFPKKWPHCPCVVMDPTNLGALVVFAQALCSTIQVFNLNTEYHPFYKW